MRNKLRKYSTNTNHTFIGTLTGKGPHLLITDVKDAGNGEYVCDHLWITVKKRYYPKNIELNSLIKFTGKVARYANDYLYDPTTRDYTVTHIKKIKKVEEKAEGNLKELLPKNIVWNKLENEREDEKLYKDPMYTETYMALRNG